MPVKPSANCYDGYTSMVNRHVGTAYDNVRIVAEHIAEVINLSDGIEAVSLYLGAFSNPPTEGWNNEPLKSGNFYLNTSENTLDYYDASEMIWISVDEETVVQAAQTAVAARDAALLAQAAAELAETNAESSAAAALLSVQNAALAKANSQASANASASSASDSATSAAEALASENAAANSAVDAAGYAADAEAAFDNFTDLYLGAKVSDPTTDNDGNPLQVGATYWNSNSNDLRYWSGATWDIPEQTAIQAANDAIAARDDAQLSETNAAASEAGALVSELSAAESAAQANARFKGSVAVFIQTDGGPQYSTGDIVQFHEFYAGTGVGGGTWTKTGNTGTPSQYPADTLDGTFFDSLGYEWILNHILYGVTLRQLGAVLDGVTDDTKVVRAAVNYCVEQGYQLQEGNGICLCTGPIIIPGHLHIKVQEWQGYSVRLDGMPENTRGNGFYFYRDSYLGRLFVINAVSSVIFENVAFDENQPLPVDDTWTPTQYEWNIYTGSCEDLVLKNVFFRKCYRGVRADNTNGGAEKLRIYGLRGQNLGIMVDVDFQSDVNRINDLHAWPYWSLSPYVNAYTKANAETILSGRNDNAIWSNIFTIAQHRAIRLKLSDDVGLSSRRTNKLHLTNSDLDVGHTGIYVDSDVSGATAQISNVTIQGKLGLTGSTGLDIQGSGCRIDLSNFRVTKTDVESLQIGGSGNTIRAENIELQSWGLDGVSAAISVGNGSTLRLGDNFSFIPGSSQVRWNVSPNGTLVAASGDVVQMSRDSTAPAIPTGVMTEVEWQNSIGDTTNYDVDLDNNEVTPLVPGWYMVNANLSFASGLAGSYTSLVLYLNNIAFARAIIQAEDTDQFSISCSKIIKVDGSTQSISAKVQQNTGSDVDVITSDQYTYLEIVRVG